MKHQIQDNYYKNPIHILILFESFIPTIYDKEMVKSDLIKILAVNGIDEHPGRTIPIDIWFLNEPIDTGTTGNLIDKLTILFCKF